MLIFARIAVEIILVAAFAKQSGAGLVDSHFVTKHLLRGDCVAAIGALDWVCFVNYDHGLSLHFDKIGSSLGCNKGRRFMRFHLLGD